MTSISIHAGDLHREVGGYPGYNTRLPCCCGAMRSLMQPGDKITQSPPKGNGANFVVVYHLPR